MGYDKRNRPSSFGPTMTIYDIFFLVFSIIYLPYLIIKGKAHRDFIERVGSLPSIFKKVSPSKPVWIHAVSVGEVAGIKNFVKELHTMFPVRKIVLSTTTKTGNAVARRIFSGDVLKFYFPLDFSFVVRKVANLINPSILIIMETEIWPNLILELSKRGVPVALINGRISDRSFKGYKKIRFFFGKILRKIDLFCMQTSGDAERIESLGALKENVKVTGNMKFDIENPDTTLARDRIKSDLGLVQSDQLLIAGSTHRGEEEIVLDVYKHLTKEFENLKLLIAPRHIDRAKTIKNLVEQNGFEGALSSQSKKIQSLNSKKVVLILDTLGELRHLYSIATIVFMGGSLIKRGGHNIVEPAIFGKPIIFGPYMFNFRDMARLFLEEKAAIKVRDKKELLETLQTLLRDRARIDILGQNARELADRDKGATSRNIRELEPFLKVP